MPEGNWWHNPTFHEPLFCVYCKKATSITEDLEHILPESLGNKQTLYRGAVCKGCNNSLGNNVDSKIFAEPMAASGQVAQQTEGKSGVRTKIGAHVKKTPGGVATTGGISGKPHEFTMSRAIAKCGVNIFTHYFGSLTTREKFPEIVEYVVEPKNRNDVWPYAAAFTPVGGFGLSFGTETLEANGSAFPMFVFLSASGVFMAPMERGMPDASELAHAFILGKLDELKEAGHELVYMTYSTRPDSN